MCARLANLCVRTFVQLYKDVCVYLYNVYMHVCVYLYNVYMHVCVRLAKLIDQAEKILQLQVNSSCSARGIIAMPPRCGCASGEIFIQTLILVQFCHQHMISMSLSPPHCGSASVQEFYRKFFANKSISVSSFSYISTP